MLKEPDGTSTGVVVIDGEALVLAAKPVKGTATKYVSVTTEKQDIVADGETYVEARTTRTAFYSTTKTSESYDINTFNNFATNTTLAAQVKQMPETILTYISDVLTEKLSSLKLSGMTQDTLDSIKTPCLLSCSDSLALFGQTSYSVFVRLMGSVVHQELTLSDNQKFVRTYIAGVWTEWSRITENLHIEVKISKGVVYLRHHYLPSDVSIILLRKKKRSKFRSTGGSNSYSKNKGKRVLRSPKTQYVHFKGIVLSQGDAGQWYVPKCISVANNAVDGTLIDKELPTLCKSLIIEKDIAKTSSSGSVNKISGYHIQGLRNFVTSTNGKNMQHRGYASIAVQIARHSGSASKDAGGEMVKLKYRISRKRNKNQTTNEYSNYIWYRSFSLE